MNEGESFHGVDPSLHGQAVQREAQEPEPAREDVSQAMEPEVEIAAQIEPQRESDLRPEHIPVIEASVDRVVKARAARLKNDQKRDKRNRIAKK